MKSRVLQYRTSVCQICDLILLRNSPRPSILQYASNSRGFTTTRNTWTQERQVPLKSSSRNPPPDKILARCHDGIEVSATAPARSQNSIEDEMQEALSIKDKLVSTSSIPTGKEIETALAYCEAVADAIVGPADQELSSNGGSAASALLLVDRPATTKLIPKALKFSPITQKYVDQLSSIAYSILLHPTVFITAGVLQKYVDLQSRLRKPDTLPHIFELYASKPVPEEGSSPIKYIQQNTNKAANAIMSEVADHALQSAIEAKQLDTAMDIVELTYAKKAFRRNKFLRKGFIPATGVAAAPIAAYAVASQVSMYQSTMDPTVATNMAFVGILSYVGFTAMIGVIAVTTANDQMDRVTWAPGIPLRERWIREEERAAIDRIAGSWGFRQTWRRGEEEGEEWETLREWVGRKGMILDRSELMEGME